MNPVGGKHWIEVELYFLRYLIHGLSMISELFSLRSFVKILNYCFKIPKLVLRSIPDFYEISGKLYRKWKQKKGSFSFSLFLFPLSHDDILICVEQTHTYTLVRYFILIEFKLNPYPSTQYLCIYDDNSLLTYILAIFVII